MMLEDKISIAVAGPFKSGKGVLSRKAQEERFMRILIQTTLDGNYWVPKRIATVRENLQEDIFEKYSTDPRKYAFEFQIHSMAQRLAQQNFIDRMAGLLFQGQPLEVDRWVYAEANREHIGDSFATYERMYQEVSRRVRSPELYLYLRIPPERVDVLQRRIRESGRAGEQQFVTDPAYLRSIIELNDRFFHEIVRKPVLEIDATDPAFDQNDDQHDSFFEELFQRIAFWIRDHKKPPQLELEEWIAVDYNRAQQASREARRQLREYLQQHQKIITLAGLVGSGKTGFAEMLSYELEIDLLRELDGSNDRIADELLGQFLRDKPRYCYELQRHLTPKRAGARKEMYAQGRSFVEDRTPEEDQGIFHRRFHQQGYLSDDQMGELQRMAKGAYAQAPKSACMIKLLRDPHDTRDLILRRGRPEEIGAWPPAELEAMAALYDSFFREVDHYGAHQGPKLEFDLRKIDPRNSTHQGYIFQTIHHALLDAERGNAAL